MENKMQGKNITSLALVTNNPAFVRKWINNGIEQKYVKYDDLKYYFSQGYVLGMLKKDKLNKMAYKISKNFTYEEMYASSTAKAKGIDNTPNDEVKANLFKLVTTILQPIRDEFGEAIIVSSGYRCPKLNTAVGGAINSEHLAKNGTAAADIHTKSDTLADNMKLWKCINKMIKDKKIKVGQFIFEYGKKNIGPNWVHVSLPSSKHTNQYLYIGC